MAAPRLELAFLSPSLQLPRSLDFLLAFGLASLPGGLHHIKPQPLHRCEVADGPPQIDGFVIIGAQLHLHVLARNQLTFEQEAHDVSERRLEVQLQPNLLIE
jgi:hypothetical protein